MGQDNAELIAEARSVLADMETRQEYDDCFARVVEALERVTPRVVTEVAELDALPDGGWEYGHGRQLPDKSGYFVPRSGVVRDGDIPLKRRKAGSWIPATVLFTPTGEETE